LREAIFDRGVKMIHIEAAIGRLSGFICHVANGEKMVSAKDAFAIAEYLNLPVEAVFNLTPDSQRLYDDWINGNIMAIDGPEARFWSKVKSLGSSEDSCWTWTASLNSNGYGQIMLPSHRPMVASRYIMRSIHGAIPDGMHVLHNCDNPPCVRPDHLRFGTATENMRDISLHQRRRKGMKLTADEVIEIRKADPTTPNQRKAIAKQFGVSAATIYNIMTGRSWNHSPNP
jgi:transcriptional regulator with XRE-family HTH domain